MQIKVADFGLAVQLHDNQEIIFRICGTPNYIAPEIIEKWKGYSYEVDIWSLGCIIYALLQG